MSLNCPLLPKDRTETGPKNLKRWSHKAGRAAHLGGVLIVFLCNLDDHGVVQRVGDVDLAP